MPVLRVRVLGGSHPFPALWSFFLVIRLSLLAEIVNWESQRRRKDKGLDRPFSSLRGFCPRLEDYYQVHQSPALTLLSAECTPMPLALVNRLLTEVKGDLLEIGQVDKT